MNNKELILAARALEEEKGIDKEELFQTIENAIVLGLKKKHTSNLKKLLAEDKELPSDYVEELEAEINRETGEIKIFSIRTIVDEVGDPINEISVSDAKAFDINAEVGGVIRGRMEIDTKSVGRLVAQNAKLVITQSIREIEKSKVFNEYAKKEFEILNGVVSRVHEMDEGKIRVFIDIDGTEFVLNPEEQVPGERYYNGQKIKVFVVSVKKVNKSTVVVISRKHKNIIRRFFEQEVPEIFEGIVVIKNIAREPGSRAKVSVYSNDENVDPLGTCIGSRGMRINNILNFIGNEDTGEKIDIIEYKEDFREYIENALSPAQVEEIETFEEIREAKVLVSDDMLSLAIGRDGQNVRLAAKLTGWKIDIISSSKYETINDYLEEIDFATRYEELLIEKRAEEKRREAEMEEKAKHIANDIMEGSKSLDEEV